MPEAYVVEAVRTDAPQIVVAAQPTTIGVGSRLLHDDLARSHRVGKIHPSSVAEPSTACMRSRQIPPDANEPR